VVGARAASYDVAMTMTFGELLAIIESIALDEAIKQRDMLTAFQLGFGATERDMANYNKDLDKRLK
jgi:hypothetical protein